MFVVYAAAFVVAIVIITAAVILRGFALSILWGWFAVPIFGAPSLGIAQAIAVSLVVTLFTHQYIPSKESDLGARLFFLFFGPPLAIGVGWIVKGFM